MSTYDSGNEVVGARWSTRRDGNVGFLLEEHLDKAGDVVQSFEFGPLPCSSMPAISNARRLIFEAMQIRCGHTPSRESSVWDDLDDDAIEALIRNKVS